MPALIVLWRVAGCTPLCVKKIQKLSYFIGKLCFLKNLNLFEKIQISSKRHRVSKRPNQHHPRTIPQHARNTTTYNFNPQAHAFSIQINRKNPERTCSEPQHAGLGDCLFHYACGAGSLKICPQHLK